VVQAGGVVRVPDVHAGALADGFEPLQNLNVVSGIGRLRIRQSEISTLSLGLAEDPPERKGSKMCKLYHETSLFSSLVSAENSTA
jgi:hypothetical protein